jgi:hypothetical protein
MALGGKPLALQTKGEPMETVDIKPIDISVVKEAEQETQLMVGEAKSLEIKTQNDFELAGTLRMKIKGRIKELDEKRKSITAPLDLAKKNIMALFNPIIDRLNEGVSIIDKGTIVYSDEQDRKAREIQARAEEEARKAREKAEAKARELEAQGKMERAAAYQAKADAVIAPVIIAATPKVAGQAIKEIWYAEVVDFKALPDDWKLPNQSSLDKHAQNTKGKVSIPGVAFKSRKIVSGRSI